MQGILSERGKNVSPTKIDFKLQSKSFVTVRHLHIHLNKPIVIELRIVFNVMESDLKSNTILSDFRKSREEKLHIKYFHICSHI